MKILSYIDGLSRLENLKFFFSQLQQAEQNQMTLMHILPEGNAAEKDNVDYSLSMQPNNCSVLMNKLADLDAQKSKINNERAHIIIDHARDILADYDINPVLKRGDFMALIKDYMHSNDILVLEKSCEHHFSKAITHITHYLEPILHNTHKPIFVMDQMPHNITKAVFAFDGSDNTVGALSFLKTKPFAHLDEIHIISVNMDDAQKIGSEQAEKQLSDAGYKTVLTFKEGKVTNVIEDMVESSKADILISGAYSHSRMRHFFLGSTTNKLLKSLSKPILLF